MQLLPATAYVSLLDLLTPVVVPVQNVKRDEFLLHH